MTGTKRVTVCDTNRDSYKHWVSVNLRYGDTDRQGHINNAVFCTLLESGRVGFLFDHDQSVAGPDTNWVIAKLTLDYLAELNFPGTVEVGSKIVSMGKSSIVVGQALFLNEQCCCTAESIIVLTSETTKRSTPLPESARQRFAEIS
ncbi:MAG TPA: thioesterase family protein [Drouetiella sp.]